jgi:glycosyltransferase involved in cell wall biosynthesis
MPDIRFGILTTRDSERLTGSNIEQIRLYHKQLPPLWNKLGVYSWLGLQISRLSSRYGRSRNSDDFPDLYHYIYQPGRISSMLMKAMPGVHNTPSLHTVTATAATRHLGPELFFARHVVTLSEFGRRTLVQAGVKNVSHIGPGIHVNVWVSLTGQEKIFKSRLELEGHPTILFPGHFGEGQGADLMLQALPKLINKVPNAIVIFACRLRNSSDKAQENLLQAAVKKIGLDQAVRFYNTVDDMHALIGASDITVLPLENMRNKIDLPTTLIETLAAAKPILISDMAPMNELITGGSPIVDGVHERKNHVGIAVPPGDADALAEAMVELLVQPDLRVRMGIDGQAYVRQNFDICKVAKQYERLYNELQQ